MTEYTIRPLTKDDRSWVADFLDTHWGSTQMVTRGKLYYGHLLPGFVAERATEPEPERIGLLTYNLNIDERSCEIISLDTIERGKGVGTELVTALRAAAKEGGIKRLWLITTNDNLKALRFWQRREFVLVAVHRDAINESRRLKPQIPLVGLDGIPIRDEIELEMML